MEGYVPLTAHLNLSGRPRGRPGRKRKADNNGSQTKKQKVSNEKKTIQQKKSRSIVPVLDGLAQEKGRLSSKDRSSSAHEKPIKSFPESSITTKSTPSKVFTSKRSSFTGSAAEPVYTNISTPRRSSTHSSSKESAIVSPSVSGLNSTFSIPKKSSIQSSSAGRDHRTNKVPESSTKVTIPRRSSNFDTGVERSSPLDVIARSKSSDVLEPGKPRSPSFVQQRSSFGSKLGDKLTGFSIPKKNSHQTASAVFSNTLELKTQHSLLLFSAHSSKENSGQSTSRSGIESGLDDFRSSETTVHVSGSPKTLAIESSTGPATGFSHTPKSSKSHLKKIKDFQSSTSHSSFEPCTGTSLDSNLISTGLNTTNTSRTHVSDANRGFLTPSSRSRSSLKEESTSTDTSTRRTTSSKISEDCAQHKHSTSRKSLLSEPNFLQKNKPLVPVNLVESSSDSRHYTPKTQRGFKSDQVERSGTSLAATTINTIAKEKDTKVSPIRATMKLVETVASSTIFSSEVSKNTPVISQYSVRSQDVDSDPFSRIVNSGSARADWAGLTKIGNKHSTSSEDAERASMLLELHSAEIFENKKAENVPVSSKSSADNNSRQQSTPTKSSAVGLVIHDSTFRKPSALSSDTEQKKIAESGSIKKPDSGSISFHSVTASNLVDSVSEVNPISLTSFSPEKNMSSTVLCTNSSNSETISSYGANVPQTHHFIKGKKPISTNTSHFSSEKDPSATLLYSTSSKSEKISTQYYPVSDTSVPGSTTSSISTSSTHFPQEKCEPPFSDSEKILLFASQTRYAADGVSLIEIHREHEEQTKQKVQQQNTSVRSIQTSASDVNITRASSTQQNIPLSIERATNVLSLSSTEKTTSGGLSVRFSVPGKNFAKFSTISDNTAKTDAGSLPVKFSIPGKKVVQGPNPIMMAKSFSTKEKSPAVLDSFSKNEVPKNKAYSVKFSVPGKTGTIEKATKTGLSMNIASSESSVLPKRKDVRKKLASVSKVSTVKSENLTKSSKPVAAAITTADDSVSSSPSIQSILRVKQNNVARKPSTSSSLKILAPSSIERSAASERTKSPITASSLTRSWNTAFLTTSSTVSDKILSYGKDSLPPTSELKFENLTKGAFKPSPLFNSSMFESKTEVRCLQLAPLRTPQQDSIEGTSSESNADLHLSSALATNAFGSLVFPRSSQRNNFSIVPTGTKIFGSFVEGITGSSPTPQVFKPFPLRVETSAEDKTICSSFLTPRIPTNYSFAGTSALRSKIERSTRAHKALKSFVSFKKPLDSMLDKRKRVSAKLPSKDVVQPKDLPQKFVVSVGVIRPVSSEQSNRYNEYSEDSLSKRKTLDLKTDTEHGCETKIKLTTAPKVTSAKELQAAQSLIKRDSVTSSSAQSITPRSSSLTSLKKILISCKPVEMKSSIPQTPLISNQKLRSHSAISKKTTLSESLPIDVPTRPSSFFTSAIGVSGEFMRLPDSTVEKPFRKTMIGKKNVPFYTTKPLRRSVSRIALVGSAKSSPTRQESELNKEPVSVKRNLSGTRLSRSVEPRLYTKNDLSLKIKSSQNFRKQSKLSTVEKLLRGPGLTVVRKPAFSIEQEKRASRISRFLLPRKSSSCDSAYGQVSGVGWTVINRNFVNPTARQKRVDVPKAATKQFLPKSASQGALSRRVSSKSPDALPLNSTRSIKRSLSHRSAIDQPLNVGRRGRSITRRAHVLRSLASNAKALQRKKPDVCSTAANPLSAESKIAVKLFVDPKSSTLSRSSEISNHESISKQSHMIAGTATSKNISKPTSQSSSKLNSKHSLSHDLKARTTSPEKRLRSALKKETMAKQVRGYYLPSAEGDDPIRNKKIIIKSTSDATSCTVEATVNMKDATRSAQQITRRKSRSAFLNHGSRFDYTVHDARKNKSKPYRNSSDYSRRAQLGEKKQASKQREGEIERKLIQRKELMRNVEKKMLQEESEGISFKGYPSGKIRLDTLKKEAQTAITTDEFRCSTPFLSLKPQKSGFRIDELSVRPMISVSTSNLPTSRSKGRNREKKYLTEPPDNWSRLSGIGGQHRPKLVETSLKVDKSSTNQPESSSSVLKTSESKVKSIKMPTQSITKPLGDLLEAGEKFSSSSHVGAPLFITPIGRPPGKFAKKEAANTVLSTAAEKRSKTAKRSKSQHEQRVNELTCRNHSQNRAGSVSHLQSTRQSTLPQAPRAPEPSSQAMGKLIKRSAIVPTLPARVVRRGPRDTENKIYTLKSKSLAKPRKKRCRTKKLSTPRVLAPPSFSYTKCLGPIDKVTQNRIKLNRAVVNPQTNVHRQHARKKPIFSQLLGNSRKERESLDRAFSVRNSGKTRLILHQFARGFFRQKLERRTSKSSVRSLPATLKPEASLSSSENAQRKRASSRIRTDLKLAPTQPASLFENFGRIGEKQSPFSAIPRSTRKTCTVNLMETTRGQHKFIPRKSKKSSARVKIHFGTSLDIGQRRKLSSKKVVKPVRTRPNVFSSTKSQTCGIWTVSTENSNKPPVSKLQKNMELFNKISLKLKRESIRECAQNFFNWRAIAALPTGTDEPHWMFSDENSKMGKRVPSTLCVSQTFADQPLARSVSDSLKKRMAIGIQKQSQHPSQRTKFAISRCSVGRVPNTISTCTGLSHNTQNSLRQDELSGAQSSLPRRKLLSKDFMICTFPERLSQSTRSAVKIPNSDLNTKRTLSSHLILSNKATNSSDLQYLPGHTEPSTPPLVSDSSRSFSTEKQVAKLPIVPSFALASTSSSLKSDAALWARELSKVSKKITKKKGIDSAMQESRVPQNSLTDVSSIFSRDKSRAKLSNQSPILQSDKLTSQADSDIICLENESCLVSPSESAGGTIDEICQKTHFPVNIDNALADDEENTETTNRKRIIPSSYEILCMISAGLIEPGSVDYSALQKLGPIGHIAMDEFRLNDFKIPYTKEYLERLASEGRKPPGSNLNDPDELVFCHPDVPSELDGSRPLIEQAADSEIFETPIRILTPPLPPPTPLLLPSTPARRGRGGRGGRSARGQGRKRGGQQVKAIAPPLPPIPPPRKKSVSPSTMTAERLKHMTKLDVKTALFDLDRLEITATTRPKPIPEPIKELVKPGRKARGNGRDQQAARGMGRRRFGRFSKPVELMKPVEPEKPRTSRGRPRTRAEPPTPTNVPTRRATRSQVAAEKLIPRERTPRVPFYTKFVDSLARKRVFNKIKVAIRFPTAERKRFFATLPKKLRQMIIRKSKAKTVIHPRLKKKVKIIVRIPPKKKKVKKEKKHKKKSLEKKKASKTGKSSTVKHSKKEKLPVTCPSKSKESNVDVSKDMQDNAGQKNRETLNYRKKLLLDPTFKDSIARKLYLKGVDDESVEILNGTSKDSTSSVPTHSSYYYLRFGKDRHVVRKVLEEVADEEEKASKQKVERAKKELLLQKQISHAVKSCGKCQMIQHMRTCRICQIRYHARTCRICQQRRSVITCIMNKRGPNPVRKIVERAQQMLIRQADPKPITKRQKKRIVKKKVPAKILRTTKERNAVQKLTTTTQTKTMSRKERKEFKRELGLFATWRKDVEKYNSISRIPLAESDVVMLRKAHTINLARQQVLLEGRTFTKLQKATIGKAKTLLQELKKTERKKNPESITEKEDAIVNGLKLIKKKVLASFMRAQNLSYHDTFIMKKAKAVFEKMKFLLSDLKERTESASKTLQTSAKLPGMSQSLQISSMRSVVSTENLTRKTILAAIVYFIKDAQAAREVSKVLSQREKVILEQTHNVSKLDWKKYGFLSELMKQGEEIVLAVKTRLDEQKVAKVKNRLEAQTLEEDRRKLLSCRLSQLKKQLPSVQKGHLLSKEEHRTVLKAETVRKKRLNLNVKLLSQRDIVLLKEARRVVKRVDIIWESSRRNDSRIANEKTIVNDAKLINERMRARVAESMLLAPEEYAILEKRKLIRNKSIALSAEERDIMRKSKKIKNDEKERIRNARILSAEEKLILKKSRAIARRDGYLKQAMSVCTLKISAHDSKALLKKKSCDRPEGILSNDKTAVRTQKDTVSRKIKERNTANNDNSPIERALVSYFGIDPKVIEENSFGKKRFHESCQESIHDVIEKSEDLRAARELRKQRELKLKNAAAFAQMNNRAFNTRSEPVITMMEECVTAAKSVVEKEKALSICMAHCMKKIQANQKLARGLYLDVSKAEKSVNKQQRSFESLSRNVDTGKLSAHSKLGSNVLKRRRKIPIKKITALDAIKGIRTGKRKADSASSRMENKKKRKDCPDEKKIILFLTQIENSSEKKLNKQSSQQTKEVRISQESSLFSSGPSSADLKHSLSKPFATKDVIAQYIEKEGNVHKHNVPDRELNGFEENLMSRKMSAHDEEEKKKEMRSSNALSKEYSEDISEMLEKKKFRAETKKPSVTVIGELHELTGVSKIAVSVRKIKKSVPTSTNVSNIVPVSPVHADDLITMSPGTENATTALQSTSELFQSLGNFDNLKQMKNLVEIKEIEKFSDSEQLIVAPEKLKHSDIEAQPNFIPEKQIREIKTTESIIESPLKELKSKAVTETSNNIQNLPEQIPKKNSTKRIEEANILIADKHKKFKETAEKIQPIKGTVIKTVLNDTAARNEEIAQKAARVLLKRKVDSLSKEEEDALRTVKEISMRESALREADAIARKEEAAVKEAKANSRKKAAFKSSDVSSFRETSSTTKLETNTAKEQTVAPKVIRLPVNEIHEQSNNTEALETISGKRSGESSREKSVPKPPKCENTKPKELKKIQKEVEKQFDSISSKTLKSKKNESREVQELSSIQVDSISRREKAELREAIELSKRVAAKTDIASKDADSDSDEELIVVKRSKGTSKKPSASREIEIVSRREQAELRAAIELSKKEAEMREAEEKARRAIAKEDGEEPLKKASVRKELETRDVQHRKEKLAFKEFSRKDLDQREAELIARKKKLENEAKIDVELITSRKEAVAKANKEVLKKAAAAREAEVISEKKEYELQTARANYKRGFYKKDYELIAKKMDIAMEAAKDVSRKSAALREAKTISLKHEDALKEAKTLVRKRAEKRAAEINVLNEEFARKRTRESLRKSLIKETEKSSKRSSEPSEKEFNDSAKQGTIKSINKGNLKKFGHAEISKLDDTVSKETGTLMRKGKISKKTSEAASKSESGEESGMDKLPTSKPKECSSKEKYVHLSADISHNNETDNSKGIYSPQISPCSKMKTSKKSTTSREKRSLIESDSSDDSDLRAQTKANREKNIWSDEKDTAEMLKLVKKHRKEKRDRKDSKPSSQSSPPLILSKDIQKKNMSQRSDSYEVHSGKQIESLSEKAIQQPMNYTVKSRERKTSQSIADHSVPIRDRKRKHKKSKPSKDDVKSTTSSIMSKKHRDVSVSSHESDQNFEPTYRISEQTMKSKLYEAVSSWGELCVKEALSVWENNDPVTAIQHVSTQFAIESYKIMELERTREKASRDEIQSVLLNEKTSRNVRKVRTPPICPIVIEITDCEPMDNDLSIMTSENSKLLPTRGRTILERSVLDLYNPWTRPSIYIPDNFGIRDRIDEKEIKDKTSISSRSTAKFAQKHKSSTGLLKQYVTERLTNLSGQRDSEHILNKKSHQTPAQSLPQMEEHGIEPKLDSPSTMVEMDLSRKTSDSQLQQKRKRPINYREYSKVTRIANYEEFKTSLNAREISSDHGRRHSDVYDQLRRSSMSGTTDITATDLKGVEDKVMNVVTTSRNPDSDDLKRYCNEQDRPRISVKTEPLAQSRDSIRADKKRKTHVLSAITDSIAEPLEQSREKIVGKTMEQKHMTSSTDLAKTNVNVEKTTKDTALSATMSSKHFLDHEHGKIELLSFSSTDDVFEEESEKLKGYRESRRSPPPRPPKTPEALSSFSSGKEKSGKSSKSFSRNSLEVLASSQLFSQTTREEKTSVAPVEEEQFKNSSKPISHEEDDIIFSDSYDPSKLPPPPPMPSLASEDTIGKFKKSVSHFSSFENNQSRITTQSHKQPMLQSPQVRRYDSSEIHCEHNEEASNIPHYSRKSSSEHSETDAHDSSKRTSLPPIPPHDEVRARSVFRKKCQTSSHSSDKEQAKESSIDSPLFLPLSKISPLSTETTMENKKEKRDEVHVHESEDKKQKKASRNELSSTKIRGCRDNDKLVESKCLHKAHIKQTYDVRKPHTSPPQSIHRTDISFEEEEGRMKSVSSTRSSETGFSKRVSDAHDSLKLPLTQSVFSHDSDRVEHRESERSSSNSSERSLNRKCPVNKDVYKSTSSQISQDNQGMVSLKEKDRFNISSCLREKDASLVYTDTFDISSLLPPPTPQINVSKAQNEKEERAILSPRSSGKKKNRKSADFLDVYKLPPPLLTSPHDSPHVKEKERIATKKCTNVEDLSNLSLPPPIPPPNVLRTSHFEKSGAVVSTNLTHKYQGQHSSEVLDVRKLPPSMPITSHLSETPHEENVKLINSTENTSRKKPYVSTDLYKLPPPPRMPTQTLVKPQQKSKDSVKPADWGKKSDTQEICMLPPPPPMPTLNLQDSSERAKTKPAAPLPETDSNRKPPGSFDISKFTIPKKSVQLVEDCHGEKRKNALQRSGSGVDRPKSLTTHAKDASKRERNKSGSSSNASEKGRSRNSSDIYNDSKLPPPPPMPSLTPKEQRYPHTGMKSQLKELYNFPRVSLSSGKSKETDSGNDEKRRSEQRSMESLTETEKDSKQVSKSVFPLVPPSLKHCSTPPRPPKSPPPPPPSSPRPKTDSVSENVKKEQKSCEAEGHSSCGTKQRQTTDLENSGVNEKTNVSREFYKISRSARSNVTSDQHKKDAEKNRAFSISSEELESPKLIESYDLSRLPPPPPMPSLHIEKATIHKKTKSSSSSYSSGTAHSKKHSDVTKFSKLSPPEMISPCGSGKNVREERRISIETEPYDPSKLPPPPPMPLLDTERTHEKEKSKPRELDEDKKRKDGLSSRYRYIKSNRDDGPKTNRVRVHGERRSDAGRTTGEGRGKMNLPEYEHLTETRKSSDSKRVSADSIRFSVKHDKYSESDKRDKYHNDNVGSFSGNASVDSGRKHSDHSHASRRSDHYREGTKFERSHEKERRERSLSGKNLSLNEHIRRCSEISDSTRRSASGYSRNTEKEHVNALERREESDSETKSSTSSSTKKVSEYHGRVRNDSSSSSEKSGKPSHYKFSTPRDTGKKLSDFARYGDKSDRHRKTDSSHFYSISKKQYEDAFMKKRKRRGSGSSDTGSEKPYKYRKR